MGAPDVDDRQADTAVGAMMIAVAFMSGLAMAHHPTNFAAATMLHLVHGAMIVVITCLTFGLTYFSLRKGVEHSLILGALVTYMIGTFGNIVAAIVNGFVVPSAMADGKLSSDVLSFAWHLNQSMALLGVIAIGAAYVLWGLALITLPGRDGRMTGIVGVALGIILVTVTIGGWVTLQNVAGAAMIYALQIAWPTLLGFGLIFKGGRRA